MGCFYDLVHMLGLLGAVLVVQSDCSRKEGPATPLLHTLGGVAISLLLKELPSAETVACSGRDMTTS